MGLVTWVLAVGGFVSASFIVNWLLIRLEKRK